MIKDHPDQVVAYFAVDYTPDFKSYRCSEEAAETLRSKLGTTELGKTRAGGFYLRSKEMRQFFTIEPHRIAAASLTLERWQATIPGLGETLLRCFEQLGVNQIKRIGFKSCSFEKLKMTHLEMVSLFTGSILSGSEAFGKVIGPLTDVALHLWGTIGDYKHVTNFNAMTDEQSQQQFSSLPQLEHLTENRLYDAILQDLVKKIMGETLYVDVDVYREEISPGEAKRFMQESIDVADGVTRGLVAILNGRSEKPRR